MPGTWAGTACRWYESVISPLYLDVTGLRLRLGKAGGGGERNRYRQLLLDSFESTEAVRADIGWSLENPGSA